MSLLKRRHLLVLPGGLLLSRCAPPPPPPPPVLELSIAAGADQNPTVSGKAAPVAIHMFQLTATAKFERGDVFALVEREKDTLGEDDAGSEEFVISPGESRVINRELKTGVQFIGIAVLFRDIDHATWRQIQPVAPHGLSKLVLTTKGITATLAAG